MKSWKRRDLHFPFCKERSEVACRLEYACIDSEAKMMTVALFIRDGYASHLIQIQLILLNTSHSRRNWDGYIFKANKPGSQHLKDSPFSICLCLRKALFNIVVLEKGMQCTGAVELAGDATYSVFSGAAQVL